MSPEEEAFKECKGELLKAIKTKTNDLSWKLFSYDIIGYFDRKAVCEEKDPERSAQYLADCIEKCICEESTIFETLLKVLKNDQRSYHDIIRALKQSKNSKTTISGRPSSISLQNENNSQVIYQDMQRGTVSMLMNIPFSSAVVHGESIHYGRQRYQRTRRESLPALRETAGIQNKDASPTQRRWSVSYPASPPSIVHVTDITGKTRKLPTATNSSSPLKKKQKKNATQLRSPVSLPQQEASGHFSEGEISYHCQSAIPAATGEMSPPDFHAVPESMLPLPAAHSVQTGSHRNYPVTGCQEVHRDNTDPHILIVSSARNYTK